jgi:hypothetical protein
MEARAWWMAADISCGTAGRVCGVAAGMRVPPLRMMASRRRAGQWTEVVEVLMNSVLLLGGSGFRWA